MSKLYGSMESNKSGTVTRAGSDYLEAHVRTWNFGVKVAAQVKLDGTVAIIVFTTSGSNGGKADHVLAIVRQTEIEIVADAERDRAMVVLPNPQADLPVSSAKKALVDLATKNRCPRCGDRGEWIEDEETYQCVTCGWAFGGDAPTSE